MKGKRVYEKSETRTLMKAHLRRQVAAVPAHVPQARSAGSSRPSLELDLPERPGDIGTKCQFFQIFHTPSKS
jgi:hypothetical protein